jgi:hypothetical protein
MLSFKKYDKYNQEIKPGDVCVRLEKDNKWGRTVEFCVYIGDTRGNSATGRFGRFQTLKGVRSFKYSNIIFAFDPLSERRNRSEEVINLTRKFYENFS